MGFGPYLLLATLEGLVTAAVLCLMAVGLSLVFGVMRVVNVAHGEFYMLGAIVAWWVSQAVGTHPAVGFLAALVLAPVVVGAIAWLCERFVLRRLKYDPEATIVATIGILYMLQQAALTFFGPNAQPVAAPFNIRIQLPWFGYSGYKLAIIAISGVLLLGLWAFYRRSRFGLVMRATQLDRETASTFGIPVERVFSGVFVLGAGFAAIAAVLITPIQQAHYLMGQDALLLSFIVVIIGGLGSLGGTVLAALLIGVADGVISVFFSPTLAKMIATGAVALVLVFRPQGLLGKKGAA
ncbi:branched-chain amino acid ABC transporter permease [Limoniibacter endophyticus]|uniref:Branched-chain amino acid ABC transporter permease n=1 Tax=Limoniibacter endophyticus TaxID=1565040 RepID=A0A8J3GIV9_9HYPH|nr:branched-chain amino acid ABC transporter permease [Limoniibacter endophyticus]GHC80121.1 branched-chain amino acid ABC transporter permease [Limoniibacter endophyticus]